VTTLSWLAGAEDRSPSLTEAASEAERVSALVVTEGYLPGLGARVFAGRPFVAADYAAGAQRVALVSDALAQRRWGGAPLAVGRSIQLDGVAHMVIGVVHPAFRDPEPIESGVVTGVWIPARAGTRHDRADYGFRVLGRLRAATSRAAAQRELSALGERLAAAYPEANRSGDDALDFVFHPLRDLTVGDARARLLLLLGAVALLLVLSCANVANLFLARGVTRGSELAVRSALGATRARLARQLFGESLLTAMIAGAVGGTGSVWGLRAFLALAPAGIPRLHEVTLDLQALGFVVLLTVLTAVVFGTVPALRAARQAVASATGTRTTASQRTQRLQSALVAAEVAVALVLVTGSALLLNSLRHMLHVDPGFDASDVTVIDVRPPLAARTHAASVEFYRALVERARSVPGVGEAAVVYTVPGMSGGAWSRVTPDRAVAEPGSAPPQAPAIGPDPGEEFFRINIVHGRFRETLDIPLLAGRTFPEEPGPGDPPVVVLNEAAARRFFPDVTVPLGRRLMLGDAASRAPLREVVGIVRDVRQRGPGAPAEPQIYVPYGQRDVNRLSLVLEAAREGAVLAPEAIRQAVRDVAHDLPIDRMEPLASRYAATSAQSRFLTFLLSSFAAIALLLAAVGTYATTSHALSRRIRELGIRIALGATTRAVFRLVLTRALASAAAGIAAGLLLALALTRFLQSYIFGITVRDPATIAVAALIIGTCATLASLGPAIRAARVDPNDVLRSD
jgi:predicted permease